MAGRVRDRRHGTILPLLAVSIVALFAFVGLAVDLGMLALVRTQSQNGADQGALVGTRTMNNKPGVANSNLPAAVAAAKSSILLNTRTNQKFSNSEIAKIEVGQYEYDANSQTFRVVTWFDVTNSQSVTPATGSWTAMRVTLQIDQPTYFMRALGVTSMPTGAQATAVFRPRDIAFSLDMTGSMAFSSVFNINGRSLNPDNLVPAFGHYASYASGSGNGAGSTPLRATQNQANGSNEANSMNNFTITTPGGPPIARGYYFDTANATNPTSVAFPVNPNNLKRAFHRWSPPESGGNSDTYTPVTYDFTGYNAFHTGAESSPKGPTPAPASFGTMTDTGSGGSAIAYVGDRWRRADGSINKTNASWSTGSTSTKAASTAIELLGYNVSSGNVRGGTSGTTTITTTAKFRDPVWETYGYDLDIVKYRGIKGNGNPMTAAAYLAVSGNTATNILVPTADRHAGYSMGPGYWGKTFFIWPPDPRTPVGEPGDANYVAGDWRRRFFRNRSNGEFDPQADNNSSTTGSGNLEGINEVLLNSGSNMTVAGIGSTTTPNWRVDYASVLRWIKSGPQTLPSNLRAGRVLYYSSIPNDTDSSTGTTQEKLDKLFWKNYIDYVIAWNRTSNADLYGYGDSWSAATRSITTSDLGQWSGPGEVLVSGAPKPYGTFGSTGYLKPYMVYTDSPNRPRLHFWFGPLSMLDYIHGAASVNWAAGTVTESQCWQLKAGMNSVIDDIRNNHPNHFAGVTMFAYSAYNDARRPLSQNWQSLKNALFYPRSLLNAIDGGDTTSEVRPYNSSYSSVAGNEIPNANGSTDSNTGMAYAFNLLAPSPSLATSSYGTIKGRRGAGKVVIFETDGVPNSYRGNNGNSTFSPTKKGYETFYATSNVATNASNGDTTNINNTIAISAQCVKMMASTNTTGLDSGLSLPNAPARVYPLAFGDLFDVDLAPNATFRPTALKFLADVGAAGNTSAPGASAPPSKQIITGTYTTRINNLRVCLEEIFQGGVQVTLVE